MLMGAGARIVSWMFGSVGFMALAITAGTLAHQKWELHKAGLRGEGRMMCTADFERAARESEREKAAVELATANQLREDAEELRGTVANELERVSNEYDALKQELANAPAPDARRCISDGMYRRLRGTEAPGRVEGGAIPAIGGRKAGS